MDAREHIQSLLAEFGEKLEIPAGVGLDDDGVCVLVFDESSVVVLELREGARLCLSSEIGKPRDDEAAESDRAMLEEQFVSELAGRRFFSADPGTGVRYLNEIRPATEIDFPRLEEMLAQFLDAVEHWQRWMGEDGPSAGNDEVPRADDETYMADALRI